MPLDAATSQPDAHVTPTRYRWFVLFVVWGAFLLSFVDRFAWSSVAAPVGQSLGIPIALLGAFVTAFYFGYVLANISGGFVVDYVGGRYALALALLPLGAATFCFSYTQSLTMGIAIQFAMGLFAGIDYAAGVKLVTAWFGKEKGRALGFFMTATSLGVVVANTTVPWLSISHRWGFAFQLIGLLTVAWGLLVLLAIRDTPRSDVARKRVSVADYIALVRDRNLILIAVAGGGALWGIVGFGAYANALMTRHYGIAPATAGAITAWIGIGGGVSKPVIGWLSDIRQRNRRVFVVSCMLCFAALLIAFGQASTVRQFYIIAPFLGAAAYGYTPLLIAHLTELSGQARAGAAAGLTNVIWQTGSALAPLAIGYVYATTGSFLYSLVVLAAGPLLGAVTMLFVASTKAVGDADATAG